MGLYFAAMSYEETSAVIVLVQMIPLFVLILSTLFLGEVLALRQLGGFSDPRISSCRLRAP